MKKIITLTALFVAVSTLAYAFFGDDDKLDSLTKKERTFLRQWILENPRSGDQFINGDLTLEDIVKVQTSKKEKKDSDRKLTMGERAERAIRNNSLVPKVECNEELQRLSLC